MYLFDLWLFVAAQSMTYKTVPRRQSYHIKLCFNDLSKVLKQLLLLEIKGDALNSLLLHLVRHVVTFDDCRSCLSLINVTIKLNCFLIIYLSRVSVLQPFQLLSVCVHVIKILLPCDHRIILFHKKLQPLVVSNILKILIGVSDVCFQSLI